MAKSLKAIVCPKCGSNKKEEIKPDFFLCQSCKTEYFLDREEITIVHKNAPNQPYYPPKPAIAPKTIALIVGIFFFLSFLIIFIPSFFGSNSSSATSEYKTEKNPIKDLRDTRTTICKSSNGKLYYLTIGTLRVGKYEDKIDEIHAYFFDEKGKEIKTLKLDISVPKNRESVPFDLKKLDNGEQYFIFNKTKLLKVLPNELTIKDVTSELSLIKEFSSGIAKIEDEHSQPGFKVMTMDGKTFGYFPIINKIVKSEQSYDFRTGAQPNPTTKTFFAKAAENITEGPWVLIKYVSKYQLGYPTEPAWFDYSETDGLELRHGNEHLIKHSRFMNDRMFFALEVLYNDEKILIIKCAKDAVDKISLIQAIDIATEKVLWTFDTSSLDQNYPYSPMQLLYTENYTLISSYAGNNLTLESKTGKLVNFSED